MSSGLRSRLLPTQWPDPLPATAVPRPCGFGPAVARVMGDSIVLAVTLTLAARLWAPFVPAAIGLVAAWLAWLFLGAILAQVTARYLTGLALRLLALSVGFLVWAQLAGGGIHVGHLAVILLAALGSPIPYGIQARFAPGRPGEPIRVALVIAAAFYLLQALAYPIVNGAGDAVWYAMNVADMIRQVRAGIFPVFSGQSIYQYNGSIYPLRIAPGFQNLCALADTLTLETLKPYGLMSFVLVTWGMLAGLTAYVSFSTLLPARRTTAAAAAFLFLACPGVLGIAYVSDLFMSWTTVPFVPIVLAATVLSFRSHSRTLFILLGAALGALWWGHTPIALWTTLIASGAQIVRLCRLRLNRPTLAVLPWGAAAFLLVAAFPIGAALLYKPEAAANVSGFQRADGGTIAFFVHEAFPGVLRPVAVGRWDLASLQLGYSLWAGLLATVCCIRRTWSRAQWLLLAAAVLFILLLTPIPRFNLALWNAVPALIRDTTGNWVMNRLYLILAGLVVTLAVATWSSVAASIGRWARRGAATAVTLACGWSLWQAHHFIALVDDIRPLQQITHLELRPENVEITRFAYLVFPQAPNYRTDYVADPELEQRFFSDDGKLLWSNIGTILAHAASGDPLTKSTELGTFKANPSTDTVWELPTRVRLLPRHRYLLHFTFPAGMESHSLIEIHGTTSFRQYALPNSGGSQSFGSTPEAEHSFSLWSSAPDGDSVAVQFYRQEATPAQVAAISVQLIDFDPVILPARVSNWIPFTVTVKSPVPGWLETPRSFQRYWTSDTGSQDVRRSPQGLVSLRAAGHGETHRLILNVPVGYYGLFWLSALSIAGAFGWVIVRRPALTPAEAA